MKVLQRYILKEHLPPFLFAFITITFLLIIEYVPKIVDQVIDKNLSIWVVLELIGLNLAWMLALSVPMSVLVATLMAFGRLTSDFEITAIKTSGINLLRIITPVLLAAVIIMVGMIWFYDKVLPDFNKRARQLYGDIAAMRPTLVFKSGQFISDIPGYLILIDHIDHITSRIRGVRITETKNPVKPRIIVADHGELHMTDNGRNMQFTLYNGQLHSMDLEDPANYRMIDFDKQVINIAGTGSDLVRTETDYRTDREMPIDSMRAHVAANLAEMKPFVDGIDNALEAKARYLFGDTFAFAGKPNLTDSAAAEWVRNDAAVFTHTLERNTEQVDDRHAAMRRYQIEIQKKFSLPAASLVFVLIGAPLAVLARRGGMGISITISILLFVVYWAFLIGGEDLADRGIITPFTAMWSANILLTVIGLYLLYVVVTERPVFAFFRRL